MSGDADAHLVYRMAQAERNIETLSKEAARARDVERLFGAVESKASLHDVQELARKLEQNTEETKGLRKTIMAFAFTVAAAGITIATTVVMTGAQ